MRAEKEVFAAAFETAACWGRCCFLALWHVLCCNFFPMLLLSYSYHPHQYRIFKHVSPKHVSPHSLPSLLCLLQVHISFCYMSLATPIPIHTMMMFEKLLQTQNMCMSKFCNAILPCLPSSDQFNLCVVGCNFLSWKWVSAVLDIEQQGSHYFKALSFYQNIKGYNYGNSIKCVI